MRHPVSIVDRLMCRVAAATGIQWYERWDCGRSVAVGDSSTPLSVRRAITINDQRMMRSLVRFG